MTAVEYTTGSDSDTDARASAAQTQAQALVLPICYSGCGRL